MELTSYDIALIDLERVLCRLEQYILSDNVNPSLQHSQFERMKTKANIDYARNLLLRLQHDSSSFKLQSQRQSARRTLSKQKGLVKKLTNKLHELEQGGDDSSLLHGPVAKDGILEHGFLVPALMPAIAEPVPKSDTAPLPDRQLDTSLQVASSEGLRNRYPSKDHSIASLFPSHTDETSATALRQHNDIETQQLTSSLIDLAQALKQSSKQFSDSLSADDQALRQATQGLDKSGRGMDIAGSKMNLLRKMSEGKGLWGRMMLYAWIAALWIAAILLVFVMPKLRF